MSALDQLHTFVLLPLGDGSAALQIMRRVDLHELRHVATLHVIDKALDRKRLGEALCGALDREVEDTAPVPEARV